MVRSRPILRAFIALHILAFWGALGSIVSSNRYDASVEDWPFTITQLDATVTHAELEGGLEIFAAGGIGYQEGNTEPIDYVDLMAPTRRTVELPRTPPGRGRPATPPDERTAFIAAATAETWPDATPVQVAAINTRVAAFIDRLDASDRLLAKTREATRGVLENGNVIIAFESDWILGEKGYAFLSLSRMAETVLIFVIGSSALLLLCKWLGRSAARSERA